MKKIIYLMLLILSISLVTAHHAEHNEIDYNKVKQLIDSNINCDKLTNEQLEEIGEYYMEQMHPGKQHDIMTNMMGLHESDKIHDDFHINLAKSMYCGDKKYMPNMMSSNMDGGMMNMMMGNNMMGSGGLCGAMMGSGGLFWMITGFIFWIALIAALILLVIWLYKQVKKKK